MLLRPRNRGRRPLGAVALALAWSSILGACERVPVTYSTDANDAAETASAEIGQDDPDDLPIKIKVLDEVLTQTTQRLSVNLGKNDPFGASQLLKNRITNPGFEAGMYATVWHAAADPTDLRVPMDAWDTASTDDSVPAGWPEGFWNGARFEILTGPAKGRTGIVSEFKHEGSENVFYFDATGPAPLRGDAIATTMDMPGLYRLENFPGTSVDLTELRAGTLGRQSLKMTGAGAAVPGWSQALDSSWGGAYQSSVKLHVVEGDWLLSFWAKAETDGDTMTARFRRNMESTFLQETLILSDEWTEYRLPFHVAAGEDPLGPYSPLESHPGLALELFVATGRAVWVDDMYLGRAIEKNPTVFTDKLIKRMRELDPGVLRYLSRQFGGDLDNQLAQPGQRRTQGWHPSRRDPQHWDYSLHEFLELCAHLGVDPWYCIPTTWSGAEMDHLIEYLAAPGDPQYPYGFLRATLGQVEPWTEVFDEVHLELGNEAWGSADGDDPFWGIGLGGAVRLGQYAHDRFGAARANPHFRAEDFDLIVGGQYHNTTVQRSIEQQSSMHDTIAIAPYFGGGLDRWATDDDLFPPLFARAQADVDDGKVDKTARILEDERQGTRLAIYEINFHTVRDETLPLDVRNDFVTSHAGALALPLFQLNYMKHFKMGPMCAFTALEYAFEMVNGDSVRIWGLMRDIEGSARKRPTWLGLELTNKAILREMIKTRHSGGVLSWHQEPFNEIEKELDVEYIQSFAFRDRDEYSLLVLNLNLNRPFTLELDLPSEPLGAGILRELTADDIRDDNEEEKQIKIKRKKLHAFRDGYVTEIPPHTMQVFTWSTIGEQPFFGVR